MEFLFLAYLLGFVSGLILALFLYGFEATNEEAKISFKTFFNLYVISRDKWTLNKDSVIYKQYVSEFRINYKEVRFVFSSIDLLRYKRWLKQKDEQDKLDQLHKVIDEIMLDAQRYF